MIRVQPGGKWTSGGLSRVVNQCRLGVNTFGCKELFAAIKVIYTRGVSVNSQVTVLFSNKFIAPIDLNIRPVELVGICSNESTALRHIRLWIAEDKSLADFMESQICIIAFSRNL